MKPGGVVIFHDARLFDGGWTSPSYGPVKLVNRLFRAAEQPDGRSSKKFIHFSSSNGEVRFGVLQK